MTMEILRALHGINSPLFQVNPLSFSTECKGVPPLARCLLFSNLSIRCDRFHNLIEDWIVEEQVKADDNCIRGLGLD